MKKFFLLVLVLFGLGGCVIGEMSPERGKLYGHDGISNICETDPNLCANQESEF